MITCQVFITFLLVLAGTTYCKTSILTKCRVLAKCRRSHSGGDGYEVFTWFNFG